MSQYDLIIRFIYDHGSITPMDAFGMGITKLATRVSEMQKKGISFIKSWVETKNRYGKPCRYRKYQLENTEILEKIREIAKRVSEGE